VINPATGRHECDRCGIDVRGGGVANCAIVSDIDLDSPGAVRTLEFCRDHPDPDDPDTTVKGCARKLVTPSMITHYTERQEATRG
jgi:hypothetical protein